MQRELADIVLEAVGEVPDLPETLVTALVEGAHALTGGTRNYRPLTAEETEAVVKYLKGNAARIGSEFDEKEIRKAIARYPGKFQQTLENVRRHREMLSRTEQEARRQQAVDRRKAEAESKVNRFRYYEALVARIKKTFNFYNIAFDEKKAMDEIAEADRRWLSGNIFTNVSKNPSFMSLGAAMKDSGANFLRNRNPALRKFIQDAFSFRNMRETELEQKKIEYSYMRDGMALAASADNDTQEGHGGNAEYDNRIAPWFSNGESIGEISVRCPEIPYQHIYNYFIDHGGAERLHNAPKPGEDLLTFLTRVTKGEENLMTFSQELNRVVAAAYDGATVERTVNGFKSKHPKEYDAAFEKCSRGMVKPKHLPLIAVWTMLH